MDNRYKYTLKENKSKSDINEDSSSQIYFDSEKRLLPVGEINHIVDLGEQFEKERHSSFIYRLQGTVNPLFSNPLMNPSGLLPINNDRTTSEIEEFGNGLNIFDHELFTTDPKVGDEISYPEAYDKYLIERDGWFGFNDPNISNAGLCNFYYVEPGKGRFDLNSNYFKLSSGNEKIENKNWEITVTYPNSIDDTHHIISNGLLIVQVESAIVGGVPMIALATATRHGLENGDRVNITNASPTVSDGEYTVKRLGLDNGDYIQNYFVIDVEPSSALVSATAPTSIEARLKKIVGGQPSEYYLRKFKKVPINSSTGVLLGNGDYEMYPLAFSNTIFNDLNYQFNINQDIDLEGLRDNLGRPISELYITFIKTNSDGIFGPLKSGLDLEDLLYNKDDIKLSNARIIHDGTTTPVETHTPLPDEDDLYSSYINNSVINDEFYGDVVEYNKFTVTETILADVLHRFNTVNREATSTVSLNSSKSSVRGPRREGYLYKPHQLYQIREFSTYIEQGDSSTEGIPDYAEDLGDGRFLWRDYLDIGFNDGANEGVNYPFTNGAHYVHKNICLSTIRQDPYNKYGLYYDGDTNGPYTDTSPFDPSDPIGDAITNNFTVKSSQNVC